MLFQQSSMVSQLYTKGKSPCIKNYSLLRSFTSKKVLLSIIKVLEEGPTYYTFCPRHAWPIKVDRHAPSPWRNSQLHVQPEEGGAASFRPCTVFSRMLNEHADTGIEMLGWGGG